MEKPDTQKMDIEEVDFEHINE